MCRIRNGLKWNLWDDIMQSHLSSNVTKNGDFIPHGCQLGQVHTWLGQVYQACDWTEIRQAPCLAVWNMPFLVRHTQTVLSIIITSAEESHSSVPQLLDRYKIMSCLTLDHSQRRTLSIVSTWLRNLRPPPS